MIRIWGLSALFLLSTVSSLIAAPITSAQTGSWSQTATWTGGVVPGTSDTVTIQAGHVVTIDVLTATAGATVVNGTLKSSRVVSSSFTLVGGDLTVNSGGTLDLGTESSPIPQSIIAHLVLALGSSAGQYGLIINNGAAFSVRGATKTVVGIVTAADLMTSSNQLTLSQNPTGWNVGDTITISPTQGVGGVEERRISAIAGALITVDSNFSTPHYTTGTIRVANLTRNVLVRSAGTNTATNTAYVQNNDSTGGFVLAHGEFAYLGANVLDKWGLVLRGSSLGMISSCAVRSGFTGIYLNQAFFSELRFNAVYGNQDIGVLLNRTSSVTVEGNDIFQNSGYAGLSIVGSLELGQNNTIANNVFYAQPSGTGGLNFNDADHNTIVGNLSFSNAGAGFVIDGSNEGNLFVGNAAYNNGDRGFFFIANALAQYGVGNRTFANAGRGLDLFNTGGLDFADAVLGFDFSGVSRPDGNRELTMTTNASLTLRGARLNPASGPPDLSGMNAAGSYLLSYAQDGSSGTLTLHGDYTLSGATVTLDYSQPLYSSYAVGLKRMRGGQHSATVCSTNDANALSQLVTIERIAGAWQVRGSVSGAMGTVAPGGSCPGTALPAGTPQFNLVLSQGASPQNGDKLDFLLGAAARGGSVQKSLLFGAVDPALNSGRSKLTIDSTGGLVLRGISGAHSIMGMLAGSTYYTFVDSGAFTAQYSSITNVDHQGLQLSGNKGVSLSDTVFDFMGLGAGTNTYITARALTSSLSANNLTFANSRSTTAFPSAYNIRVQGVDTGLSWTVNSPPGGALWGESYDDDPNLRVSWGGVDLPPTGVSYAAVHLTSATVTYGTVGGAAYMVEASTASNFTGTLTSSVTLNLSLGGLAPQSLIPNTTYFFRAGALWSATTFYANAVPASTMTLAARPDPISFSAIGLNGFTLSWPANSNPSTTRYEAAISTDINFGAFTSSLTTTATSVVFGSLTGNTTYFARVRAVSHAGTPTAYSFGGAITATGVITISADRLNGVWYANLGAVFNAQGALTYHFRINSIAVDLPDASDPVFDGSAMSTGVPQGVSYFHVWGRNGLGASLGYAHFGPINSDVLSPTVASIAAQVSSVNGTSIPDGGATSGPLPRFSWAAAASASPIVGYAFSLSLDPSAVPSTVNTTLTFLDSPILANGTYHAKVRALNLAGTFGSAIGMSIVFDSVPSTSEIGLKKNRFNPLRGECTELSLGMNSGGKATAKLYTILGQPVATLVDQDLAAGTHTYRWCGANSSGQTVSTGVYLLRVSTPQQKRDLKILVAK